MGKNGEVLLRLAQTLYSLKLFPFYFSDLGDGIRSSDRLIERADKFYKASRKR